MARIWQKNVKRDIPLPHHFLNYITEERGIAKGEERKSRCIFFFSRNGLMGEKDLAERRRLN